MDNRAWSDADSYYMSMEDEEDDERHTCDYTLLKAGLNTGVKFVFTFDFGDDWQFRCNVLKKLDEKIAEPEVVRAVGDHLEQYAGYDERDFF